MDPVIHLGSLVIPWLPLHTAMTLLLGLLLADWLKARTPHDVRSPAKKLALVALLGARVGHLWSFWGLYAAAPWQALNVFDGGWDEQAGLVLAWLYAAFLLREHPAWRKPLGALVLLCSVWWVAGLAVGFAMPQAAPGPDARPLVSYDASKREALIPSGQITVVNFWATWCPPCKREMPALQQAERRYSDVRFVLVNQGESAGQVAAFLKAYRLNFQHVLLDRASLAGQQFGVNAYPTTLFFDDKGKLVAQHVGELSGEGLSAMLDRLLQAKKKPGP